MLSTAEDLPILHSVKGMIRSISPEEKAVINIKTNLITSLNIAKTNSKYQYSICSYEQRILNWYVQIYVKTHTDCTVFYKRFA